MCTGHPRVECTGAHARNGARMAVPLAVLSVLALAQSACAFHALEQKEGLMALCECYPRPVRACVSRLGVGAVRTHAGAIWFPADMIRCVVS